ncbi:hypothetical protein OO015_03595 [Thermomicrobium sp. 4228-Ro]|uniref:hypothetical protein n=1 Tax=Thermomicrobium sp. 4228-Ro TaxID=2993937 RepID=UPI002248CEF7|nr:hypothetical protein [Thermomicrobium sp. 4228-Ro]MCX2726575.1 hypothetical protein [Thermomicrobium sp. 4228-Ro]
MSKALVQELVARLVPLIDRDTCITVFEFVNEMYRQSEGYIEANIDRAIAWFRPGCDILHDRSSELPEWDDRETWEAVQKYLGDFPVVRTTHYLGTLGAIGWEAAEALGITEWLGYAREYPASPSGSGGPLGWADPIGGVWERPGLDAKYDHFNVDGLEITLEEARGCYLWMVTIMEVCREVWYRVADLGYLAEDSLGDWPDLDDASPLERARIVLPACDRVVAAVREGRGPGLDGADQWFEELKPVIAVAAIVPEELRAVQTTYDAGLLLTGRFREALDPAALAKAGLADEVDDLIREMEWSLIEVRPWIERVPEPGSPEATVHLSRWWEIPATPLWLAWQAVFGYGDLPFDPYSIR